MEVLVLSALKIVVVFGALIFVHELGHFILAKAVGIRVERLSLGFGPKVLGFTRGQTQYWLSALPVGGYVKMAGQEDLPSEELEEEAKTIPEEEKFYAKSVMERAGVVIAGPLMNLLFGWVLFCSLFTIGMMVPAWSNSTKIGYVKENSPAQEAGLLPGDEILSINGQQVQKWVDLVKTTLKNPDEEMTFEIRREGLVLGKKITPTISKEEGKASIGIYPYMEAVIGKVQPGMPADEAGLKSGDMVLEVDGQPASLTLFQEIVKKSPEKALTLTLYREGERMEKVVVPKRVGTLEGAGEALINEKGEVIHRAKDEQDQEETLQKGDFIIGLDGQMMPYEEIDDAIAERPGSSVVLEVKRPGKFFLQEEKNFSVPMKVTSRGLIGIEFDLKKGDVLERYGPLEAVVKGTSLTLSTMKDTLDGLYLLIRGKVSHRELAGPIGIVIYVHQSAQEGFLYLLGFVAFISITLCLINLFPIPILDGGHILFLALERLRNKPLKAKHMELLQRIGLVILISLVLLATYNDLAYRVFGE